MIRVLALMSILIAWPVWADWTTLEKPFETLIPLTFALALDVKPHHFDQIVEAVGAERRGMDQNTKLIGLLDENSGLFKSFIVRRFKGSKTPEIFIVAGKGDRSFIYYTGPDGTLRRAAFKKGGDAHNAIAVQDVQEDFVAEVAWWLQWEKEFRSRSQKDNR